jgi:hypothetical protein
MLLRIGYVRKARAVSASPREGQRGQLGLDYLDTSDGRNRRRLCQRLRTRWVPAPCRQFHLGLP